MHDRPNAPTTVLSTFPFSVESDAEEERLSDSEEFKASLAMWETVPLNTYPWLSATRRQVRAESDGAEVISSDSESSCSHSSWEDSSSASVGGKRKRGYSSSPRPRRRIILPASWRTETSRQDEESDWLTEGSSNSERESSEGYEGSEEYDEEDQHHEDEEWPEEYDGMEKNENWEVEDAGEAYSEYVAQEATSPRRRRRATVSPQSSAGGSGGERNMRHWCLPCQKDFHTSGGLSRHKQSTLHAEAQFQCTICGKWYQRYDVLQKHIKLQHPVELEVEVSTDNSDL